MALVNVDGCRERAVREHVDALRTVLLCPIHARLEDGLAVALVRPVGSGSELSYLPFTFAAIDGHAGGEGRAVGFVDREEDHAALGDFVFNMVELVSVSLLHGAEVLLDPPYVKIDKILPSLRRVLNDFHATVPFPRGFPR